MSKPILVTYATRLGSTAEVAGAIASALRREGEGVDVRTIADVTTLDDYRAVILGSPIRVGKWLREAVGFVEKYEADLARIPVAYFTVCMTLHDDTQENRRVVLQYHQPLLYNYPDVRPLSIGMFAGKVDYGKLSWLLRLYATVTKIPEGDWRNWKQIETWTREVLALLEAEAQPL